MKEDTKKKILSMLLIESENDLLTMQDERLVECYSLLHCPRAWYAVRYYDECNEDEKREFATVIRDCIRNGKFLVVGRIWREGVFNEANYAYFKALREEKHHYRYAIFDSENQFY